MTEELDLLACVTCNERAPVSRQNVDPSMTCTSPGVNGTTCVPTVNSTLELSDSAPLDTVSIVAGLESGCVVAVRDPETWFCATLLPSPRSGDLFSPEAIVSPDFDLSSEFVVADLAAATTCCSLAVILVVVT